MTNYCQCHGDQLRIIKYNFKKMLALSKRRGEAHLPKCQSRFGTICCRWRHRKNEKRRWLDRHRWCVERRVITAILFYSRTISQRNFLCRLLVNCWCAHAPWNASIVEFDKISKQSKWEIWDREAILLAEGNITRCETTIAIKD